MRIRLARLREILLVVALGLFFAAHMTLIAQRQPPRFQEPATKVQGGRPVYREHWISRGDTKQAHSANLVIHGGELVAVWYGGTEEGAADVALFTSGFEQGKWSRPRRVMDRPSARRDLSRSIRKLGNPVLHSWNERRLGLFFVTVSMGGWAGSSINYIEAVTAADGTRTWGRAKRLVTSPFINISTLVRHPGFRLEGGSLLLPVYHEFLGKFAEVLTLSPELEVLDKTRLSRGTRMLQPAIAPTSGASAIAMLRYAGSPPKRLMETDTTDGLHWRVPRRTVLPNPGAAVAITRTGPDELLLAYNDTEEGRHQLALATRNISAVGGGWIFRRHVEKEAPAQAAEKVEFSYPSLAVDARGIIHLAYTWNQKEIKHLLFNRSWLYAE